MVSRKTGAFKPKILANFETNVFGQIKKFPEISEIENSRNIEICFKKKQDLTCSCYRILQILLCGHKNWENPCDKIFHH